MFSITIDHLIAWLNLAMLLALTASVIFVSLLPDKLDKDLRKYRALVSQYKLALEDEMRITDGVN